MVGEHGAEPEAREGEERRHLPDAVVDDETGRVDEAVALVEQRRQFSAEDIHGRADAAFRGGDMQADRGDECVIDLDAQNECVHILVVTI